MSEYLFRPGIIDTNKLSSEFYFHSLVEQAAQHGLIDAAGIQKLQFDCLALLAKITERFNGGYSSSVPVERAQSLMTSLLFTVSLTLKMYPNAEDAVQALQKKPFEELYQRGRACIQKRLASTKAIHAKLLQELIQTENICYGETIVDGINGFFKSYDPDFGAHEIHITADYPLLVPLPALAGIEFIKAYVNAAYYENKFCSFFAADRLRPLLCGYAEDYADQIINLYEPVFAAALGAILCGDDIHSLNISTGGAAYLEKLFGQTPRSEHLTLLKEAMLTLTQTFVCTDGLTKYMEDSLLLINSGIGASLKSGTLHRFFPLPLYTEGEPQLRITFGSQMDDEAYRQLLIEIADSTDTEYRLSLVRTRINSLADLETILLDADFTEREFLTVFEQLSLPEIAALLRRYHPILEDDCYGLLESELHLRGYLKAFLANLPSDKFKTLERIEMLLRDE